MKKYLVDDTEYFVYSKGSGPILLFAHGFPFDSRLFVPVVDRLSEHFQCVVPDLRGFGMTKLGANGRYSVGLPLVKMGRFADDLAILTAILACQRHDREAKILFCGLSMGGYVALAFARRRPERLAGMIFCDSNETQDNPEKVESRLALAKTIDSIRIPEFVDSMIPTLLSPETLKNHPLIVSELRDMMCSQSPEAIAAAARGMARRSDSTETLMQLEAPTLVLGGADDVLATPEVLDRVASKIPHATRVTIPHAGHLPSIENPDAFANAILEWSAANVVF